MKPKAILIMSVLIAGCIKNSSYSPVTIYNDKLNDLSISFTLDSLPADGASKDTLNLIFLKGDLKDSINISALNLSVTTSAGTFVNNGMQSLSITPQYKLDTANNLELIAQVILQSSAKKDSARLKFTYAGVEKDSIITFYAVFPDKISLSASTLQVSPNFKTEDTVYAQLSRKGGGTPTAGAAVTLVAWDDKFTETLGIYRTSNGKSNAMGQCSFIFVLGDSTLNHTNYTGTINLVGATSNSSGPIMDTIQIYSR